ncbi:MAG: hypothetical protein ACO3VG_06415, partial [Nitriliruptoraceae bacterium]
MGQASSFDGGAGGPQPRDSSRRRAISAAGAAALGITTFGLPSAAASASPFGDGEASGVTSTGVVSSVPAPGFVL